MSSVLRARALLLVLFALFLPACGGGGLRGDYVNPNDPQDRVFLDGSKGRVAALVGESLAQWDDQVRRPLSGKGPLAPRTHAVELVDVEVTYSEDGRTLTLKAPGRGVRVLTVDPQADEILVGGRRKYFRN